MLIEYGMNLLARFKRMKKETKIEIFFWLVVLFVFSPRILLEVYEHKLKNSLTPFENNEWNVKDKDGNIIYENLTLPYDLRWKEQKTNRREWIFEKTVQTDHLKNLDDLGIVLGRVGDSDYVMFNDCVIGSTGFDIKEKKQDRWSWSLLRGYKIDQSCLKFPVSEIKYHIYKWGGPGFGVIGGPFGFTRFSTLDYYKEIIDTLRYGIQFAFGIGLIFFIGFQYLFLRLIAQNRESYGTFGLLSISVGMFLIMTSVYPFRMFNTGVFLEFILFASAIGAAVFFLKFFQQKFNLGHKKLLKLFIYVSLGMLVVCGFQKDFDHAYRIYEIWHPIFLLMFLVFFFSVFRSMQIKPTVYSTKYFIAYTIFVICSIHDVVITLLGISNAYLIGTAFPFFVLVVALYLSREYSDAFTKVEEQVVLRTHQLNTALVGIQEIQKQKDDQAKRFAHDIRSPLAALQVLKDIISSQLSGEEKNLFKHTIVRINDLANTALPKLMGDNSGVQIKGAVFLWPVMDKLISEKRLEYQHLSEVTLELKNSSSLFELHALCEEIEFTRIISNLINNSIEARNVGATLNITIDIQKSKDTIEISIQDNGKGISPNILTMIFDDGFTYGKKGGMGVGLKHAKKAVEEWSGTLIVDSTEGVGTQIRIQIPASAPPEWLVTKLNLQGLKNLVVIDDQSFVVDAWKQRMLAIEAGVEIFWVQNRDGWEDSKADQLNWNETLFLVDHDLASRITGLEMITQLKLGPRVMLVTGNDDDLALRKRAMDIGISILPKGLIHTIPIEV